ncbi:VOC family protein [Candidatus Spongiihabitans sp.]|uniref:VOC family protein n=1 Tax=Candidatus Spongiihabitans sp. TaxID=3101308 RepID=UPI003C7AF355
MRHENGCQYLLKSIRNHRLKYLEPNYLMIETGGSASAVAKSLEQNPVCLRFNVDDVEKSAAELHSKGVSVKLRKEVWGTVVDFVDPDGNRCSLRDETTF